MHDKIYSRPRIKIPRGFQFQMERGKGGRILRIIIIFIIAVATAKYIVNAVHPIFDTICTNRAETIATISANEQATKVMNNHTYDEMFKIEKDSNENITMIASNIIAINEIISDVAVEIEKDLDSNNQEDISIALR